MIIKNCSRVKTFYEVDYRNTLIIYIFPWAVTTGVWKKLRKKVFIK